MINKFLSSKTKKLIRELDWDCSDQYHLSSSLNIIHWHPASFITAIPANIIDIFTEIGDVVWDPFCGAGASATEAFRKGRRFYGSDINEIAILITKAKINVLKHRENFLKELPVIDHALQPILFNPKREQYYRVGLGSCSYKELEGWYNPEVLADLVCLWGFLKKYNKDEVLYSIFTCIFSSIAKLACAQQKTWGHIADNVKPKKEQLSIQRIDVIKIYLDRIKQVASRSQKIFVVPDGSAMIEVGDCRYYKTPELVDLIITSPPYPQMADYITSQRLAFYWLGHNSAHISIVKKDEIGARNMRHNAKRNDIYVQQFEKSIENILSSMKRGGTLAMMMPNYSSDDNRKETIDKVHDYLDNKLRLMYRIDRNVSELLRWAPFKSLKKENLSIWSVP